MDFIFKFNAKDIPDGENVDMVIGRTIGILHYIVFLHDYREPLDITTYKCSNETYHIEIKNCPEWIKKNLEAFLDWVRKDERS